MNNIKKIIANKLALSFFIASIIILAIYIFLYKKVEYYVNIINTTAISNNEINKDIKYDKLTKRIIGYPNYGEKYADLIINKINVNLPIYHGDNLELLGSGIGHYAGSYFPGEDGTIILAGHNTESFLKRIEELIIDDEIMIKTNYGTFKYSVFETKIVNETDENSFKIDNNKEVLIIYTCYPINEFIIGRRTKRYVVYANLIGDSYE